MKWRAFIFSINCWPTGTGLDATQSLEMISNKLVTQPAQSIVQFFTEHQWALVGSQHAKRMG